VLPPRKRGYMGVSDNLNVTSEWGALASTIESCTVAIKDGVALLCGY
jgi:hypothetical protein